MSGQVRLMTHADLTDADITAALQRIGPVEGTRTGGDPSANGTGSRRSPVRPGRR
jgi:threonine aldolase